MSELQQVKFYLKLPSHWESKLADAFPGTMFSIILSNPLPKRHCRMLMRVKSGDMNAILDFLNTCAEVEKATLFAEDVIYVSVRECPLSEIMHCVHCIEQHPTPIIKEEKIFRIILSQEDLDKVVSYLEEQHIEVLKMTKKHFDARIYSVLTKRQQDILEIAIANGYYHFPKKVTVTQLAKVLDLSPSTVSEHLHGIEHRVFTYFAENEQRLF